MANSELGARACSRCVLQRTGMRTHVRFDICVRVARGFRVCVWDRAPECYPPHRSNSGVATVPGVRPTVQGLLPGGPLCVPPFGAGRGRPPPESGRPATSGVKLQGGSPPQGRASLAPAPHRVCRLLSATTRKRFVLAHWYQKRRRIIVATFGSTDPRSISCRGRLDYKRIPPGEFCCIAQNV